VLRSVSRSAGTALAALALAGPLALLTAAPAAAKEPASLTVVHGVRGLVADVRMDGELVLSGFAPERVTDALEVPAGRHRLQAWPSGSDQDADPVVDQVVTLEAGQQATAAVGLDAEGGAKITLYDDGELLPDEGDTALVVRGLAQAGPVRVVAGERTLAPELTSSAEAVTKVEPGTYEVSAESADGATLVAPQEVPVAAGRAVVLYLVGSQSDDTLGWVAQTVRPAASGSPTRIDTGSGPLPGDGPPASLLLAVPVVALAALAVRRRART
jgi:hypothetical protein